MWHDSLKMPESLRVRCRMRLAWLRMQEAGMVRPASCCRLHAACDQTHGAGLPQGNVSSPQHVLHGIAYLSAGRRQCGGMQGIAGKRC